jgi:hypothetical protein
MPGLRVLAAVTPDNTPHGYNLTFAVPIALFAVVAVALYLLFSRPHRRIPARRGALPARGLAAPGADAARAAAVAGGLAVAAGGGAAESHLEPAGHIYAAGPDAPGPADPVPADLASADPAPAEPLPAEAAPASGPDEAVAGDEAPPAADSTEDGQ